MPRIEKVMLLIAGLSIAAGAVIGFGHRNTAEEAKGQLTAAQLAELGGPPVVPQHLQVAPQPTAQELAVPAQPDSGSAQPEDGEESGAEDGSGS